MDAARNEGDDEPALYLLYLYLWPFWMFRDVGIGNLFEQAAAKRYNFEHRVYLPGYVIK